MVILINKESDAKKTSYKDIPIYLQSEKLGFNNKTISQFSTSIMHVYKIKYQLGFTNKAHLLPLKFII